MISVKGVLEIDTDRGVVYFTETPPKNTRRIHPQGPLMIRVCQLPKPVPRRGQIDITVGHGASYTGGDQ